MNHITIHMQVDGVATDVVAHYHYNHGNIHIDQLFDSDGEDVDLSPSEMEILEKAILNKHRPARWREAAA